MMRGIINILLISNGCTNYLINKNRIFGKEIKKIY